MSQNVPIPTPSAASTRSVERLSNEKMPSSLIEWL